MLYSEKGLSRVGRNEGLKCLALDEKTHFQGTRCNWWVHLGLESVHQTLSPERLILHWSFIRLHVQSDRISLRLENRHTIGRAGYTSGAVQWTA